MLMAALVVCLGQAFTPLDEFIHRGDDAFYYFQVALNHVQHGEWTFDGIHSTNGVQPLWAWILTGSAHALSWIGVNDPLMVARVFVAINSLVYLAACVVLYALLAQRVSVAVALAAVGAALFPLGATWGRMWGMETAIYLLLLLGSMAYFHSVFLPRRSLRSALVLGLLLAACVMGRLNGVFFIASMLLFYALRQDPVPRLERLRWAVVVGLAASSVILVYLAWNYFSTGHPLPISGAVKVVRAEEFRTNMGVVDVPSAVSAYWRHWSESLQWLAASRIVDGFWIIGGRAFIEGAIGMKATLAALALAALAPLLAGASGWIKHLRQRFTQLGAYAYFAAFAVVDAVASILIYPAETYAATRWWFIALELVLTVATATLVVASVGYVAERWIAEQNRVRAMYAAMLALAAIHVAQFTNFFWDGQVRRVDWNASWNDEPMRAAHWINANLPENSQVGAWNAGVLGYFSEHPVVNLDGLINNFDLLPYLKDRKIADYIRQKRLTHIADLEPMMERTRILEHLPLTEVYRSRSEFMDADYVIYRVHGLNEAPIPSPTDTF
jgi:hypothetical protein